MNDPLTLGKLPLAALSHTQQRHLFTKIDAIFGSAIYARSPQKRPPGKAGLRAEKGYYRLLYLENDLHEKVDSPARTDPGVPSYDWDHLNVIMRQLADIPELQSEILNRIKSALEEIATQRKTHYP